VQKPGLPTIYLAGPISGCNDEQQHVWRNELKSEFSREFQFIDPADNLIWDSSGFEIARADQEAIRSADAVLANMWKESIGTAFGIVHANAAGKVVVACDPNLIGNRMLAFYADSVERSLMAAMDSIRAFLAAEREIKCVRKVDGEEEPFDRQKLAKSVRKACLAAEQSDMVPARAVVARAVRKLLADGGRQVVLTTTQIRNVVWEALAELAADPLQEADYDRIRAAWEEYSNARRATKQAVLDTILKEIQIHDAPLKIPWRRVGNHSLIWGNEVGSEARRIFFDISRVTGIVEVRFGQFKNTGAPPAKPHVRLQASKSGNIIEGVCYDNGRKGTLQTFQIRVADEQSRDAILTRLREHLLSCGHIRSTVASVSGLQS
jgi:transcriptional regulator NrdR family protein/nucleoside 2-deoxyribosyltransferase